MESYKSAAAVYLRKSRMDDDSESVDMTLARHNSILNQFAIDNNITIAAVYKEVVSGEGLFTRPQMIALLNAVERGEYTAVLCMDIDRLGRSSVRDSGIIMETLQANDCVIITPEKTYNLADDVDEMTVELKTFFARQELKSITKRLRRGEIEVIKSGGHTGEPPYGYERKWIDKMPTLAPTRDAEIVKLIFNKYVNEQVGCQTIADYLNELRIKAPGGGEWSRSSVLWILRNPYYTGKVVWGRKKRIKRRNPTDKYREVDVPRENWIVADGLHEAIISEEIFETAQEILKSRSHPPAPRGIVQNPYAGLIYCANCGAKVQRQKSRATDDERLLCPRKGCNSSIKLSMLDKRVKLLMEQALSDIKLSTKQDNSSHDLLALNYQVDCANDELASIKAQREKLYDLLEQGVYSVELYMQRSHILNDRQADAEFALKRLGEKIDAINNRLTTEQIAYKIENILREWDVLSPVEKNTSLKSLVKKIYYTRSSRKYASIEFKVALEWNFSF